MLLWLQLGNIANIAQITFRCNRLMCVLKKKKETTALSVTQHWLGRLNEILVNGSMFANSCQKLLRLSGL